MEIKNYHQEALVSGVQSRKYGFEMNAKMYDILISKMYTNKPGAVIRELSANAWDAHVEAGKADVPFEIHLPTWLDKSFHIRDYGTGIPHDKFEHIYTNVGSSTKEDTNELIGGFGLGSKTPFTMTDTFIVENWCDGRKTTWVCFKDKGEPQVSKVADESSDEPSGLKVSFSFDEGDVLEFTMQVPKQLRYFPVKPKITGGEGNIEFKPLPDGWETKEYFYTKGDRYSRENYVVMGNVCYSLSYSEFPYEYHSLFDRSLTIKVGIGDVDIPPSREHLEMTPRTKAHIVGVLNKIRKEYADDVQDQVSKCKTSWDLRKVLYEVNKGLLKNPQYITWKGKPVDWYSYSNSLVEQVAGYRVKAVYSSYANVYRKSHLRMRAAIDGLYEYYVNDLGQGFSKHINDNYSSYANIRTVKIFHIDGITKKNKDTLVQKAISDIEAEIGEKPKLLSSIIGFPAQSTRSTKVPSGKSEPNQVFLIDSHISMHESLKKHMEEQSDLPKDGYYFELNNWSLRGDPKVRARELIDANLVAYLDKPLYAVRAKTVPKLDKSMIPITYKLLESFEKDLTAKAKEAKRISVISDSLPHINEEHFSIGKVIKDKQLAAYMRYSKIVKKKRSVNRLEQYSDLYHRIFFKPVELDVDVPVKLKKLNEKYKPIGTLLETLTVSWNPKRTQDNIDTLINFINDNR